MDPPILGEAPLSTLQDMGVGFTPDMATRMWTGLKSFDSQVALGEESESKHQSSVVRL